MVSVGATENALIAAALAPLGAYVLLREAGSITFTALTQFWIALPLAVARPRTVAEVSRFLALCHAHFTPVVNHVWGSAIAVATNLQLLAAMPPLPGGLFPREPMLEFDTTDNRFRDDLLVEPLDIQQQVKATGGYVSIPTGPGLGVEPDREFIDRYRIDG